MSKNLSGTKSSFSQNTSITKANALVLPALTQNWKPITLLLLLVSNYLSLQQAQPPTIMALPTISNTHKAKLTT